LSISSQPPSVGRGETPMTDNQLAKELHELKRRRETPLPLIKDA
jgi:hypothetical protein